MKSKYEALWKVKFLSGQQQYLITMLKYNIFLLNGNTSTLNHIQFLVAYNCQVILSHSSDPFL